MFLLFYLWVRWVFVAAQAFLWLQQGVGGYSLAVMQGHLIAVASLVAEHSL